MPSISSLVLSLSLDVTENLVAAGITSPVPTTDPATGNPITIIGATATTPIVVTLSAPAPWSGASAANPQKITAVIDGVEGMTEANGTWILTPTAPGASTCTLTTYEYFDTVAEQYAYSNIVVDSVGVNPYTGGGTITCALVDGRITLGAQHLPENSSPPRIMMRLSRIKFTGADENARIQGGFRGNLTSGHGQSTEQIIEQTGRMVAGENDVYEVTVWGAASPPDPDADWDAMQVLAQQFVRTLYYVAEGCYKIDDGGVDNTQTDQLGHKVTFPVTFYTPVLDYVLGSTTVQSIAASVALEVAPDSTPETGWSGEIT